MYDKHTRARARALFICYDRMYSIHFILFHSLGKYFNKFILILVLCHFEFNCYCCRFLSPSFPHSVADGMLIGIFEIYEIKIIKVTLILFQMLFLIFFDHTLRTSHCKILINRPSVLSIYRHCSYSVIQESVSRIYVA